MIVNPYAVLSPPAPFPESLALSKLWAIHTALTNGRGGGWDEGIVHISNSVVLLPAFVLLNSTTLKNTSSSSINAFQLHDYHIGSRTPHVWVRGNEPGDEAN